MTAFRFPMRLFRRSLADRKDTFAYTVNELNRIRATNTQLAEIAGGSFGDGFRVHKTSETLFILGSGPSINTLTEADLVQIREADSIGFNYWPVHPLVPRFYMFQLPPRGDAGLLALLRDRAADYGDVPIILRGSELGRQPTRLAQIVRENFSNSELYYMNEFPIHSKCTIPVDDLITFVENLGLFTFGRVAEYTVKWRGTLGLLLSMAYQVGYKRIILCGIDMNDSRHFYDAAAYDSARSTYDLPSAGASNIETMMNRRHGPNTVGDYVGALSRRMRQTAGVEILLASETSALRDVLPLWRR